MISRTSTLSRAFFKCWEKLTAAHRSHKDHGVLLHDPAADRPHDLDDPFFDNKTQARIGKAIANAMQEKEAKP